MSTTQKYRIIYNNYTITAVMEEGDYNTASADNILIDTKENIINQLTPLGIDCSSLEHYQG